MKKEQLQKIIKEEIQVVLKEEMQISLDLVDQKLIELNKAAEKDSWAKMPKDLEVDRRSWILGYQKALKDAAEELLGYIF